MANTDNFIDKDELIGAVINLDSISYLMQEITEDFFIKFNPESNKDISSILWEFSRNRAKAMTVYSSILEMQQDFKENGITPYWE